MVRRHSWLIITLTCFCSWVRSFGTHLSDFFMRPRALWSMV
jgi:hypothetical protein